MKIWILVSAAVFQERDCEPDNPSIKTRPFLSPEAAKAQMEIEVESEKKEAAGNGADITVERYAGSGANIHYGTDDSFNVVDWEIHEHELDIK